MKSILRFSIFTFLITITSAIGADAWLTNLDEGFKIATQQKKSLIVVFTGSDWCGPCQAMKREVWANPQFIAQNQNQFVLVELDFPKWEKQEASARASNDKYMKSYRIVAYPTSLVLDFEGRPLMKLRGYRPKSEIVKQLRIAQKILKNRDNALLQAKNATNQKEKLQALGLAAKEIEKIDPEALDLFYCDLHKEILKIDTTDTLGYKARLAKQKADRKIAETIKNQLSEIKTFVRSKNPQDAIQKVQLLRKFGENPHYLIPVRQEIYSQCFKICYAEIRNIKASLNFLEKGIALDPQSALGKEFLEIKADIQQALQKH